MGLRNLSRLRRATWLIVLTLTLLGLMSALTPRAETQNSNLTVLSYQAFNEVAQVYQSGGTAPGLITELNVALTQIQQAKLLRAAGNVTGASQLEEQALATMKDVEGKTPEAQLKAQQSATNRTLLIILSIPAVVIVSTSAFYAGLRTWRVYEKTKLFEMKIVENRKTED